MGERGLGLGERLQTHSFIWPSLKHLCAVTNLLCPPRLQIRRTVPFADGVSVLPRSRCFCRVSSSSSTYPSAPLIFFFAMRHVCRWVFIFIAAQQLGLQLWQCEAHRRVLSPNSLAHAARQQEHGTDVGRGGGCLFLLRKSRAANGEKAEKNELCP